MDDNSNVKNLIAKVRDLIPKRLQGGDIEAATKLYVDFHLFHFNPRMKQAPAPCKQEIEKADFGQMVHLLHSYPALLRPLGLVVDLEFDMPKGALAQGQVTVRPEDLSPDVSKLVPTKMSATAYALDRLKYRFYTQPDSPLGTIRGRLLNLQTVKDGSQVFEIVKEETEQTTQKILLNQENDERAKEYSSTASERGVLPVEPRKVAVQDGNSVWVVSPPAQREGTQAPPATQTAQITLLNKENCNELIHAISEDKQARIRNGTMIYHAEDLVLGSRVDVRYKEQWHSLCKRTGSYKFTKLFEEVWEATAAVEKAADEGYISFAGSQIEDESAPAGLAGKPLTKVSPSLFSWNGTQLTVPAPDFGYKNNEVNASQYCDDTKPEDVLVDVDATYRATPMFVPLRYGETYQFRCRVVDLAGNSISCEEVSKDDEPTFSTPITFTRKDPVNAPKILLERALDSWLQ